MVNSFQKVKVETSLFPDYILDDTLHNNTPNGDNGINDNDDENYINDNNGNIDCDHHNDYNDDDDNDNNYDNDNGGQTVMIL